MVKAGNHGTVNNIYEREKLMQKRANLCRLQQQGMVLKILKAVAG